MGAFWGKTAEGEETCIFCKIAAGKEPKTTLLYQDEDYVVFSDIHPASTHHYLIVPKKHVKDTKSLTRSDIPLVNRLVEIGKQVLEQRGGSMDSCRMGFHWPPFTSISHLHLHVIAPTEDMSMLARLIFRPRTPWFCLVEDTMSYLEQLQPPASS
uniref:Adenosine 5'-monophosphoramidase HINT3 n=1 Tax=Rhipicephalus appendiculatus TaxID=34631 RepID=A0A131Z375_RHIAP